MLGFLFSESSTATPGSRCNVRHNIAKSSG
nr:MAG TPA: hypothetical protein [Caudoviricetes sp.]